MSALERYEAAMERYWEACATDMEVWHRPDVAEFSELKRLLLPKAEGGDVRCQYALACILSMGLCCESEEEFAACYASAQKEATPWWLAAARQGHWGAIDNLVASGVGPEAERARAAFHLLKKERPDLVPWTDNMPIYGPEFFEELGRRLYGKVMDGAP